VKRYGTANTPFVDLQIVLTNKKTQESNVLIDNEPITGGFTSLNKGQGAYSGYADIDLPPLIKTMIQVCGQAFVNRCKEKSRVLEILTVGEASEATFRFESRRVVDEKPQRGTFTGNFFNFQTIYSGVVTGRFYRIDS